MEVLCLNIGIVSGIGSVLRHLFGLLKLTYIYSERYGCPCKNGRKGKEEGKELLESVQAFWKGEWKALLRACVHLGKERPTPKGLLPIS